MTEKTEPVSQAAAWTVRVPATGKILWAEARPECLDTWRQEWEHDGFEVIPLYLHPSSSIEGVKVKDFVEAQTPTDPDIVAATAKNRGSLYSSLDLSPKPLEITEEGKND